MWSYEVPERYLRARDSYGLALFAWFDLPWWRRWFTRQPRWSDDWGQKR